MTAALIADHEPVFSTAAWDAEPLLHTRRRAIYRHILDHPGVHVRGVEKDLRIATGDMQYHLRGLEKQGLVKTRRVGLYRFVYPTNLFEDHQELLLGVLSQEMPREILLCLIGFPGLTQRELARRLHHSSPTIWWHMEKLAKQGMVRRRRTGKAVTYEVVADRAEILRLVRRYHPGSWDRWERDDAVVVQGG